MLKSNGCGGGPNQRLSVLPQENGNARLDNATVSAESNPLGPTSSSSSAAFSVLIGSHSASLNLSSELRANQQNFANRCLERSFHEYFRMSTKSRSLWTAVCVVTLVVLVIVVYFGSTESFILFNLMALATSLAFVLVALWMLSWILSCPEGDAQSAEIVKAIQQGAEGFYATQNAAILRISGVIAIALFICYALRDVSSLPADLREGITPVSYALVSSFTFLFGAFCSALSGYSGVWVSVRANSRVAAAAFRTYEDALRICFRGGAFSSIINVALAVGGLASMLILSHLIFPKVPMLKLPLLLVGFGFGASLVAMFAQLGGGIYTKAADVGADLVGKVEAGIPEDDYRNPAVIADLVGDNVGDCAGQCADLFESLAAEMLAAMILGSALAGDSPSLSEHTATGFVLFPLAVHSVDLLISTIAVFFVGRTPSSNGNRSLLPTGSPSSRPSRAHQNPLREMITIYFFTCVVGALSFTALCYIFLNPASAPDAWRNFALCGLSGIACALIFLFATQYYTDYNFNKVRRIAKASLSGPATNIITGLAVGMESTAIPVVAISIAIVFSYHQGLSSGVAPKNPTLGGLFGTAVATMGMLSTAVYVLSMSSFGPIADNAGGIVEMTVSSNQESVTRDITDRLDAVGNVTKANTKGFSVGTAALASFLLFSAFLDEVSVFVKQPFKIVDITTPDVFVGGLLGAALIFVFSSMALNAVGKTAAEVVTEVRRQFKERPNIMTYQELPDYKKCVKIVSERAVRQMILPGLLACLSPIVVGLVFKVVGSSRGTPLLGVEALGAFMMFATSTGILTALFLNNGGGAWDNAKKYIETGVYGGKGSAAHKAAVVGDTVGDPCKDTAGPSVHVLIKLVATVTLVMTPLFV